MLALLGFVIAGLPVALERGRQHFVPFFGAEGGGVRGLLHGTALMFVAYTGYGRIATLAEEVREPRRTVPRAILVALGASAVIYGAVAVVAVGAAGAPALAAAARGPVAPLEVLARGFGVPGLGWLVAAGALAAMLGVLLNLLLGLSRVVLAMGRRGDLPRALAAVDPARGSPRAAVVAVGLAVGALVATGDVATTWSFSAFTVLVYYAITDLAALRLPAPQRPGGRWVAASGLAGCVGLAFWVEPAVWGTGLMLAAAGLGWHLLARRRRGLSAAAPCPAPPPRCGPSRRRSPGC
ncbi:MAG: hypothetical protein KatS3mg102_2495 [Planctomycetota bacterium]|nr:MAG: hypothetical protein KatS3mg102_2495 [Planctomycetota bacterium]